MSSITACPLPDGALLARYQGGVAHTDCYAVDVRSAVTHVQWVTAFYTTPLFKVERLILRWAISRPSTDTEAAQLAVGAIDEFAAWRVEARAPEQLLLSDLYGRTRSWLMVAPLGNDGTRLYFGSAVVPRTGRTGRAGLGLAFRALLGFHKLYSLALVASARARLRRH